MMSNNNNYNADSAKLEQLQLDGDRYSPKANTQNDLPETSPDYLGQLLKDKHQLQAFPTLFTHAERLVEQEINRVRIDLFNLNDGLPTLELADPKGPKLTLQDKVFIPVKEYPDFNFVGRILGPRGMTAKQIETNFGVKLMVRGQGSMRDKQKEEANRGKPNWEHLNEDLHVLIVTEDTEERAKQRLKASVDHVNKLMVPGPEGEDELKRKQLMELAIINGTFRQSSPKMHQQVLGRFPDNAITTPLILNRMSGASLPFLFNPGHQNLSTSVFPGTNLFYNPTDLTNTSAQTAYHPITIASPMLKGQQADEKNIAQFFAQLNSNQDQTQRRLAATYDPTSQRAMLNGRKYLGHSRDHPYLQTTGIPTG